MEIEVESKNTVHEGEKYSFYPIYSTEEIS
jgi:hypothetical protein